MPPIIVLIALLGASYLAQEPTRADWYCRNDIEVDCSHGECEVSDSEETSTMSLLFNEDGKLSYCAYSGCWSGKGKVVSQNPFLVISLENAEWNFEPLREKYRLNILVAFDPLDQVAIAKVGGWSHPFRCSAELQ